MDSIGILYSLVHDLRIALSTIMIVIVSTAHSGIY